MAIKNAKTLPKVYYGMHMEPGVAEYAEPDTEPYRILICENALKNMDATYAGKPVYVEHVEEVDLENIQSEADGYVMESFFNTRDGKHWVKFIVVSDEGHEAVRRGWQLSNSYVPQSFTKGGEWHGVHFAKEITGGEYEHLAIVPNPRYEASIIMTPEEFKQYNNDKDVELKRLTNAKKEKEIGKMGLKLNFLKRTKVDNSAELSEMSVVLPKSGKEITIEKLVTEADERAVKKSNSLADPSDKVKMHDGNMCNVGELVKKHKALHDENEAYKSKQNTDEKESEVEEEEESVDVEGDDKAMDNDDPSEADDAGAIEEDKDNDDDDDDGEDKKLVAEEEDKEVEAVKKKKNDVVESKKKNVASIKEAADKKAAGKVRADKVRNAHLNFEPDETAVVELMADQVARGKSKYGSN